MYSNPFTDVKAGDWYDSAGQTAYTYNLISGFTDGTFRPNDKITREQAMTIIAKAMGATGLKAKLQNTGGEETLRSFADAKQVSLWAKERITDCLQAGLVSGRVFLHIPRKRE
ncbi:S-layer homology domain-containing protein [Aneurinibacillus sp. BA2021]|nr:S-layer homology domain-containing protein [Aneurinibacillus sp. BA2021]